MAVGGESRHGRLKLVLCIAAVGFAFVSNLQVSVGHWPGWRGDGSGVASPSTSTATQPGIIWKTPITGIGHSSPIVFGNRVFVTTAVDGVGSAARATHLTTVATVGLGFGVAAWILADVCVQSRRTRRGAETDTPTHKSKILVRFVVLRLAVFFVTAVAAGSLTHWYVRPTDQTLRFVMCLDLNSGVVLWRTECATGPLLGATRLTSAASATPVTDGKNVFACFGTAGTYCLDFEGKIQWRNEDGVPDILYKAASSPVIWNDLLILTHDTDSRSFTVALDKETGTRKWISDRKLDGRGRRQRMDAYSTPIIIEQNDQAYLIHDSYRQLCCYEISRGREIWCIPTDAEQVVTSPVESEGIIVFSGECNHPIHLTAVRLNTDGGSEPEQLWQTTKQVPAVCSPVIINGLLFTVSKSGIATCRDLKTGEVFSRLRLPGRYYASATIIGNELYLSNLDGLTTRLTADRDMNTIGEFDLGEGMYASVAVTDRCILFRGLRNLVCIGRSDERPLVQSVD